MIIFEEESILWDEKSPYKWLLQIFTSSLIAKVLRVTDNVDVSYVNNFDLHGDDTVQSMLLLGNVVREEMEEICQHCLHLYKHDVNNSPECILFSSKVFEIERLLSFAQENL